MSTPRPQSLCGLPTKLKLNIIQHLYKLASGIMKGRYGRTPGEILLPLSLTSRAWRNVTLPFVFQQINLFEETNEAIAGFLNAVASKYGHHCRSLRICLQPLPISLLGDSEEINTIRRGSIAPWAWQGDRNALLFAIMYFMPNLVDVVIVINDCPWHHDFPPCGCPGAYELLMGSLAERALTSITVDFGCARSSQNGCVDWVTKTLLGTVKNTVEGVYLFHHYEEQPHFTVENILDILEDLPHLRHLGLAGVCSFADIFGRTWTSPLQTLFVYPSEYQKIDDEEVAARNSDTFLAFESLPYHLGPSRWEHTDSFNPRPTASPSNLTLLRTLTLSSTVTGAILTYLRASKLFDLCLLHEFDFSALSHVLKDDTAFPCLKTLTVWFPTGSQNADTSAKEAAEEHLSNVCKARHVTTIFGPPR